MMAGLGGDPTGKRAAVNAYGERRRAMERTTIRNMEIPEAPLPAFLEGLELPATKDDAIAYADEHGATDAVLEFLERLPAAVYTSDAGLRHAFSTLGDVDLSAVQTVHEEESEAKDGISS
jgi:hypothetical protein